MSGFLRYCVVVLICAICLVFIARGNAAQLSDEAQALYDLFHAPDCVSLCFLGIEPKRTTETDLRSLLSLQDINYALQPAGAITRISWHFASLPYLPKTSVITATIKDGTVEHITGVLHVPVETVIAAFGNPTSMTGVDGVGATISPNILYLLYPSLGLGFKTIYTPDDDDQTISFMLSWPGNGYSWSEQPNGEPITTQCSSYETWPCFAPTATTLPPRDKVAYLRSLFDPACAIPCYLGLEPGVTMLDEIAAKLPDGYRANYFEGSHMQWIPLPNTETSEESSLRPLTLSISDNGVLLQTIDTIDTTPEAIIEVFGSPEIVSVGPHQQTFVYPSLGLEFIMDEYPNLGLIVWMHNSMPNASSYIARPPATRVYQPCDVYDTPPCVAPTATPLPAAAEELSVLRSIFGSECRLSCVVGIEPGVTTQSELEAMLVAQGLSYALYGTEIRWELPPQRYVTDGRLAASIRAVIRDEVVIEVQAPLNVSVAAVEAVFGSPDRVVVEDAQLSAIYERRGLAFIISRLTHRPTAFFVISGRSEDPDSYVVAPFGEDISMQCSMYITWPCIMPTATPSPSPMPNPQ